MMCPLVTVAVPVFNHEAYVEKTILSILNQTYNNIKLVVIDDGSSDNSVEVIKELNERFDFVFVSQENRGCAATLNRAIREFSEGKYFSISASDDYWAPDKIEKQVAYMEKNEDVPFAYNKNYFVDEDDRILERETEMANSNLKGGEVFNELIFQKFHPLPGYIFRRDLFDDEEVGLYKEGIWTEDFYLNLKIAKKYKIGFIDDYLSYYRYPSNFNDKLKNIRISEGHKFCIDMYKSEPVYAQAIKLWHFRNFVWYSSIKKHKLFAIKSMLHSLSFWSEKDFYVALAKLVLLWR
ncbi:glycosyltransferase family 2 protein [Zobellella denitrificans]|uniref:glycosyltransferase family 2 protein n=1 Tax=Zobellella denitrificans TaxID=347534 RepID=UPI000BBE1644|nr:glycosyltransferase [Zobellella denitrificans]